MNLLGKVLSRVVLLILVTSMAIGGVAYFKSSKSTNELMMNSVDQQLELNRELINEKLNSSVRMLEIVSSGNTIKADLRSDTTNSNTSEVFTDIVASNSDLLSLVSLVNSDGIVINTDDANTKVLGANLSERDYMLEVIEKGETVISDVIYSKADSFSSQALQFKVEPMQFSLPSGVVTQGRFIHGGLWRTCCLWPQSRLATQSRSSS